MLEIQNLEVVYEDVIRVLDGVSLTVPEGSIVALLGANGAGKTTVLRAVTGLLDIHRGEATKGTVTFEGEELVGRAAPDIVKRGIAQVMEGRRVFAELSVDENLRAGGYSAPRSTVAAQRDRVYELFPRLAERPGQTAGLLSGGEQQMLAVGRALMCDPRLLILDEPSLGLAPLIVEQIRDLITQINADGTTVLLVEQNAAMALSVASHGYVMETGRIVMDRSAAELAEDEDIREFYLGLREEGATSYRDVKHYRRRKRWLS